MDETQINGKGRWTFLQAAVDHDGQTLVSLLSEHRHLAAARRFFKRVILSNGMPD